MDTEIAYIIVGVLIMVGAIIAGGAMICWSIGTLAFSILLVISDVVPQIIGWLGSIASILVGFGTGLKLIKPKVKYTEISALSAILFEIIIGGWLLFSPII